MINVGVSDNINYVRSHLKEVLIFLWYAHRSGIGISNIILPAVSVLKKKQIMLIIYKK